MMRICSFYIVYFVFGSDYHCRRLIAPSLFLFMLFSCSFTNALSLTFLKDSNILLENFLNIALQS